MTPAAASPAPGLQDEANSFLNRGGTEMRYCAGDLQRPFRGILGDFVNQAEFSRFAAGKDAPGEGEFQGSARPQAAATAR